jgi:2-methylcitrate dehydratase PrpD
MLATCHPSAPPIAALLALLPVLRQQRADLRWGDILRAYIVGTETTLRLGQWLGFPHYALGFHATSTLGTVGAAAACAHALRLPLAQAHAALSIAASSACGLRANFGTDVKPLHVGFAAAAAVRAVLLASAGAAASDDVWARDSCWRSTAGSRSRHWPGRPACLRHRSRVRTRRYRAATAIADRRCHPDP